MRLWIERHKPERPRAVHVTDEASGEMFDADQAIYVRSFVVTTPITQNRIHVFRNSADAEKHAEKFGGIVESENPFGD